MRTGKNKSGPDPGAKCEMLAKNPDEPSVRKFEMRNVLLSQGVHHMPDSLLVQAEYSHPEQQSPTEHMQGGHKCDVQGNWGASVHMCLLIIRFPLA